MVKNFDERGINGTMVNCTGKFWNIILEDNTVSLEARRGKNKVWEDKEVGLVFFWKGSRKIERNGMRKMENVILLKGNWCMGGLYVKTRNTWE